MSSTPLLDSQGITQAGSSLTQPSKILDDVIARLYASNDNLDRLCNCMDALGDALFGTAPQAECKATDPSPGPNGKLEALTKQLDRLDCCIEDLNSLFGKVQALA